MQLSVVPSFYQITILCGVVINVMFNALEPLFIVSERIMKNEGLMQENDSCG
jgi:hypothetical protein